MAGRMATTRTNIELDDELIETAMRLYGTRTKRQTVELALRRLVGDRLDTESALALEGTGWAGDLTEMRHDAPSETA
jgi:Arc/MetJ family transcription regulator